MRSGEIRLYRAVREAVPVVDAAIYKLIRMVGGVTAVSYTHLNICAGRTWKYAGVQAVKNPSRLLAGRV